jgi:hypothetical protein
MYAPRKVRRPANDDAPVTDTNDCSGKTPTAEICGDVIARDKTNERFNDPATNSAGAGMS